MSRVDASNAPRSLGRRTLLALGLIVAAVPVACAHPAERALQGRWNGQSVENFDEGEVAAATGWARGTSFVFNGNHLRVTVPAESPRTGVFRLAAIEDRQVSLMVLDHRGEETEMDLIVDDAESIRWVLDDGRTLVLKREN